jgi:multicomponent K+:H+ antiporter subunit G
MSGFDELSPVVAALVGLLAILGAALALIGSFGLLRLPTFYQRVHPPTMGTTGGAGLILAASMLLFSALESRPVLHEIVIAAFVVVTTPVTYMLLMRAAVHRDRTKREEPDATGDATPKAPSSDAAVRP